VTHAGRPLSRTEWDGLLQAARGGDPDAVQRLLETYRDYLHMVARREMPPNVQGKLGPSDIVQETLVCAHAQFSQIELHSERALAGWLQQILRSRLVDQIRRYQSQKRECSREQELTDPLPELDVRSPLSELVRREDLERLREAMTRLPSQDQELIRLYHEEGLSLGEIGRRVRRHAQTVRRRLRQALHRLDRELK